MNNHLTQNQSEKGIKNIIYYNIVLRLVTNKSKAYNIQSVSRFYKPQINVLTGPKKPSEIKII